MLRGTQPRADSCGMQFCLLVGKLLSCGDLGTLDFRIFSKVGNYSSRTIGHGKILSLPLEQYPGPTVVEPELI